MKIYILIVFFLFGCDALQSEKNVKFGGMEIPRKYVVMGPGDGSKGVYDDSGDILVALFHDEIIGYVSGYKNEFRGNFDTIIIYPEPHDTVLRSKNILSSYRFDNIYFVQDIYTPYRRLYENKVKKSWLLVSGQDNALVWVASCSAMGMKDEVDICFFEPVNNSV